MSEPRRILVSQIIAERLSQGLAIDGGTIDGILDRYIGKLNSGDRSVALVDDRDETIRVPSDLETGKNTGKFGWMPISGAADETLLNDFINGIAPGFLRDDSPATLKEDPIGYLAGLSGMLFGAGKFVKGASGLGGVVAKNAGYLGAHGAASSAARGGTAGDIAKSGGLGAALGAALPLVSRIPLPVKPGMARNVVDAVDESLLWGGLEKAMNPDATWGEVGAMAIAGPLIGRGIGAPYRTRYEPLSGSPAQKEVAGLLPAETPSTIGLRRAMEARAAKDRQTIIDLAGEGQGVSSVVGPENSAEAVRRGRSGELQPTTSGLSESEFLGLQKPAEQTLGKSREEIVSGQRGNDVTLGIGLGGAQGMNLGDMVGGPYKTEDLIDFAPRPPASSSPGSMAAWEGMSTGNIAEAARHAARVNESSPSADFDEIIRSVPDLPTKHEGFLTPRTDVLQKAFGGEITNAATREVLGTIEDIDLAQMQTETKMIAEAREIFDMVPSERMMSRVQEITEVISSSDVYMRPEELVNIKPVSDIVKDMSPQYARSMVEAGQRFREYFDRWHKDANRMLAALEEPKLAYRDQYWPHKIDRGVLGNIGQSGDPAAHSSPSSRYRPAHTKERTGQEFRQKDPRAALDIYAREHSGLIWNNLAIKTLARYEKSAMTADRPNIAATIKNISDLDYGGRTDAFTQGVEKLLAAAHATPLGKIAVKLSGKATEAQLGGNIGWMLTTQPSSVLLTPTRVGEYSSALAGKMMADRSVRDWVGQVSYAVRTKRGGHGGTSAITQDILGVSKDLQPKNLWDKWTDLVSRPASVIENETTVHAFLSGYIARRRMGGSHEEAIAAGDDTAKKYQLIYDRKNAPGILKSPYASLIAKYQRFVFQMYNNLREAGGLPDKIPLISKTGAFKEAAFGGKKAGGPANATARRALLAAKLTGIVLLQNWANDELTGRELWSKSSVMPGYGLAGGDYFGKYGNYPWIIQFMLTGKDAISDFVNEGDPAPFTKFLFRYLVPGGSQAARTLAGARAISGGGMQVGSEFTAIDSDSVPKKLQMLIWGPHSTGEMREYWDELDYQRVPVKSSGGSQAPSRGRQRSGRRAVRRR